MTNNALNSLVSQLDHHGITLDAIDRWKQRSALCARGRLPAPTVASEPLDASVEELGEEIYAASLHRMLTAGQGDHHHTAMGQLQDRLDEALREAIRASADHILDRLRPEFDAAANGLRTARELGVQPDDTMESLFEAGGPVRTAWLAAENQAKRLQEIFWLRIQLTVTALVPPVPLAPFTGRPITGARDVPQGGPMKLGFNWSQVVLKAGSVHRVTGPASARSTWLAAAPDLELRRASDFVGDEFESLAWQDPRLHASLLREAERRVA